MSAVSPAARAAALEVLRSGWLTMGPRTAELEDLLRERFGRAHAVATASGSAALHLNLLAAGVGPGSRVLVPDPGPASCAGTVEACSGTPVAYALTGLDPPVELGAGEPPVAVIARHNGGLPAELGELAAACSRAGASLIEDCRDAFGARAASGDPVGGSGRSAILSFGAAKQVPAGEGGAVLTDDEDLAAEVRSLRSHAMTSGTWDRHRGHAETYDVVGVGFNYRIDEVRAAMAAAGIAIAAAGVEARRERLAAFRRDAEGLGAIAPGADRDERSDPIAGLALAASPAQAESLREGLANRGWKPVAVPRPGAAPGGIGISERLVVVALA
jgi:dTDP-4-amino-4,6-dideoxygalactose transaminase